MTDLTKDWLDETLYKLIIFNWQVASVQDFEKAQAEAKQIITDKLREARIEGLELCLKYPMRNDVVTILKDCIAKLKRGKI